MKLKYLILILVLVIALLVFLAVTLLQQQHGCHQLGEGIVVCGRGSVVGPAA